MVRIRQHWHLQLQVAFDLVQVEKLLAAEAESVDEEEADALAARCRQLERIAGEVSRLKFFTARGQVNGP